MGGLRKKMPVTFWTFVIGGLALSGFPLLAAGFWSKDEIFSETFGSGHLVAFITLAIAAFLTAFYTARQITLTFLGEARTKAAEHAHEAHWTMTVPLVVLSVFALGAGWIGIPLHFPLLGGLIPDWFHDFVGGTLATPPQAIPFSAVPLLTSLIVTLGGLLTGWLVYRKVSSPEQDFLQIPVLKNKWYIDEIFQFLFIKPSIWFGENIVYKLIDLRLIDGTLDQFGKVTSNTGSTLRNYFDKPVLNNIFSNGTSSVIQSIGRRLRPIQTGRIQQYMVVSLIILFAFAGLLYYLLVIL